ITSRQRGTISSNHQSFGCLHLALRATHLRKSTRLAQPQLSALPESSFLKPVVRRRNATFPSAVPQSTSVDSRYCDYRDFALFAIHISRNIGQTISARWAGCEG